MLTAFKFLSSAIPWFVIPFGIQAFHEVAESAEQINNRHYFQNQPFMRLLNPLNKSITAIISKIAASSNPSFCAAEVCTHVQ